MLETISPMGGNEPLPAYLARQKYAGGAAAIVLALAQALPPLADRVSAEALRGEPGAIVGINKSGDEQKALDAEAHDLMIDVLRRAGVRQVLSEEAEEVIQLNAEGRFDVAIDPIDGSGNIGVGAPLGMLFSILPASQGGFLRSGRAVVAAGYASFGHSTDIGFSLGEGVTIAVFDRSLGEFRVTRERLRLSPSTRSVAYNASNERHWPEGLRRYVRDLLAGREGPRGKDFNMRWLAAAVGDLHRILLKGGAFMYPADGRPGYARGHLRLVYEAVPIAFLMEQAGGLATNGRTPILDLVPDELHEKTPLLFGAAGEIETLCAYLAAGPENL